MTTDAQGAIPVADARGMSAEVAPTSAGAAAPRPAIAEPVATSSVIARLDRFAAPAAVLLLLISSIFRFLWLGRCPGINGDEAQAANQIIWMLRGLPYSLRSNFGQFFNPLMLGSWALEFSLAKPTFFLLRFPAAVWSCVGLAINYGFYRVTFHDRRQALMATTLLACMPLHIAFSRLNWDPTYTLLTLNFVLYPLLWLARGPLSRGGWIMLVAGVLLCGWVHATTLIFIVGLGVSVFWQRRRPILAFVAKRSGMQPTGALLAGLLLSIAAAAGLAALALLTMVGWPIAATLATAARTWAYILENPEAWIAYVAQVGEFVSGARAYKEFAGLVETSWIDDWLTILSLVGLIAACVELLRRKKNAMPAIAGPAPSGVASSDEARAVATDGRATAGDSRNGPAGPACHAGAGLCADSTDVAGWADPDASDPVTFDPADVALARFWIYVPFLLGATCSVMALGTEGDEQYVLWILPAGAILYIRAAASWAVRRRWNPARVVAILAISVSTIFLVQFWRGYFLGIEGESGSRKIMSAYATGPVEPKQAAAEAIVALTPPDASDYGAPGTFVPAGIPVYAEDWRCQHPIQFLLGPRYQVTREILPDASAIPVGAWFVVGSTDSPFIKSAQAMMNSRHIAYEMRIITARGDRPFLALLAPR
jgi:hypothetical protein